MLSPCEQYLFLRAGQPLGIKLAEYKFPITQIQKHGLTADLVEGVTVGAGKTLDGTRTVQVRGEGTMAPPYKVAQYKKDMEAGDVFAPVFVTSDYYVLDGNTRLQAYLKLDTKTITVFRLHMAYAGITDADLSRLEKLGAAMNRMNGAGMPKKRMEELILRWWKPGGSARDLARDLHFPDDAVRRVIKVQEGRQWLARIGVTDEKKWLKASHFEQFASWDEKMTDVILAGVATLASEAKFTVAETVALGQKVIELKSEVAKLDYIEEQDRVNEDRKRGVSKKVSPQGQFRQALGAVAAFRDNPLLGVERGDADDRKHTQELLKAVLDITETAYKEQLGVSNPDAVAAPPYVPFTFGRK